MAPRRRGDGEREDDGIAFEALVLTCVGEFDTADGEGVVVAVGIAIHAILGRIHLRVVQFQTEGNYFVHFVCSNGS